MGVINQLSNLGGPTLYGYSGKWLHVNCIFNDLKMLIQVPCFLMTNATFSELLNSGTPRIYHLRSSLWRTHPVWIYVYFLQTTEKFFIPSKSWARMLEQHGDCQTSFQGCTPGEVPFFAPLLWVFTGPGCSKHPRYVWGERLVTRKSLTSFSPPKWLSFTFGYNWLEQPWFLVKVSHSFSGWTYPYW